MMEIAEKRKYKGEFGVNVGTKVPPATFNEIENLAKALGKTRAGIVRLLLHRGRAEYQRDQSLTPQPRIPLAEMRDGSDSNDDRSTCPTCWLSDSSSSASIDGEPGL